MNDNDTVETASIADNLYSTLETLYDIDNDLVPESERLKLGMAAVLLMLIIHRLCGDTPDQIDERLHPKEGT